MGTTTTETLATIERCVTEGGSSLKTALESAYQLGKMDGGLEVALLGMRKIQKLDE